MEEESTFSRVLNLVESFQLPLILALLGIIFVGLGFLLPKLSQTPKEEIAINTSKDSQESANKIVVDVSGAVKNPGLYTLESTTRIADALEAAGGFSETVDNSWVAKNINLASKVTDGQKIYINTLADASTFPSQTLGSETSVSNVNINTASASELDKLPDIGPARAQDIIEGRPYQKIEDLLSRKIVGQSVFNKIKDKISAY